MQTMRVPSASLEEIMKLGPIQIYFGTQYIGDAIPREFPAGGFGFSLNKHVQFQPDTGVRVHCHASLIMMVRPDPATYSNQSQSPRRLSA